MVDSQLQCTVPAVGIPEALQQSLALSGASTCRSAFLSSMGDVYISNLSWWRTKEPELTDPESGGSGRERQGHGHWNTEQTALLRRAHRLLQAKLCVQYTVSMSNIFLLTAERVRIKIFSRPHHTMFSFAFGFHSSIYFVFV